MATTIRRRRAQARDTAQIVPDSSHGTGTAGRTTETEGGAGAAEKAGRKVGRDSEEDHAGQPRRLTLPGWPAVLHEECAAAYVSLSATTFRKEIMPQVKPIQLTRKRIGWRKDDLDDWVARRGGAEGSYPPINPWDE